MASLQFGMVIIIYAMGYYAVACGFMKGILFSAYGLNQMRMARGQDCASCLSHFALTGNTTALLMPSDCLVWSK